MNPLDMLSIVEGWEKRGYVGLSIVNGRKIWVDFCVYDGLMGIDQFCPWLVEVDGDHVRHIDDKTTDIELQDA